MGVRYTHVMGLSGAAWAFLNQNAVRTPTQTCPTCGHTTGGALVSRTYAKSEDGMFDDGPGLEEYDLSDGRKAREVVQCVPWSSGPCIFLCLEIDGVRHYEWTDEEIRENL